ncbi:BamA/TamA family outer membrane protein [uncultured Muribaculum sp.]|uniref:BamA/TamA family outer membrane protein n=2 Tax=Muribaculum TaxID=1918540 RepID=UPI0025AFB5E8|nr:BamA/TamA family outer membrane protein [uncultured Muribaculum sp.]
MRLIKAVSHILAIVMLFAAAHPAFGQETVTSYGGALLADTCSTSVNDVALTGDSVKNVKKPSVIQRVLDYFARSNEEKPHKRFDFSILGGPHYSSDVKLGLGLVAAGLYRTAPGDTVTPVSNVSLYGDVATSGFAMVGIRGNHIFRNDRRRIDYDLYFSSFPTKFWGIGYDNGVKGSNETDYKELTVDFTANFTWQVLPNLYVGPSAQVSYVDARNVENPLMWQGGPLRTTTIGLGGVLRYDTRDNLTATTRGWMLQAEQRFCPRFLGNGNNAFSFTRLTASTYVPVWRGCTLALQARAVYNYGNVPWSMMSTFGGNSTMRGYYKGRYRDKAEADLTVEFRQHLWHRIGMVVWGGVATVAPSPGSMRLSRLLPNCGIGYRWEFKRLTNIRVDYGIGRGCSSFIFSINEAF